LERQRRAAATRWRRVAPPVPPCHTRGSTWPHTHGAGAPEVVWDRCGRRSVAAATAYGRRPRAPQLQLRSVVRTELECLGIDPLLVLEIVPFLDGATTWRPRAPPPTQRNSAAMTASSAAPRRRVPRRHDGEYRGGTVLPRWRHPRRRGCSWLAPMQAVTPPYWPRLRRSRGRGGVPLPRHSRALGRLQLSHGAATALAAVGVTVVWPPRAVGCTAGPG